MGIGQLVGYQDVWVDLWEVFWVGIPYPGPLNVWEIFTDPRMGSFGGTSKCR